MTRVAMFAVLGTLASACGSASSSDEAASSAGGGAGTGGSRGNPSVPEIDTGTGDPIHHTYEPTLDAIYNEIFYPTCAAAFCHTSDEYFFNALTEATAYETTVSVVTDSPECGPTGLQRVVPFHPEKSLLYLKLTDPPCGVKMPKTYTQQIDPREIEQIRQWIAAGAPRVGRGGVETTDGGGPPVVDASAD